MWYYCITHTAALYSQQQHGAAAADTPEEEEEDHPSESRPYKQYCTTLLTPMKAEAILIGSHLQGKRDKKELWSGQRGMLSGRQLGISASWLLDYLQNNKIK